MFASLFVEVRNLDCESNFFGRSPMVRDRNHEKDQFKNSTKIQKNVAITI